MPSHISPFEVLEKRGDFNTKNFGVNSSFCSGPSVCSGSLGEITDELAFIINKILVSGEDELSVQELLHFLYTPTVVFSILAQLVRENDNPHVADIVKQQGYEIFPGMYNFEEDALREARTFGTFIGEVDSYLLDEEGEYELDNISFACSYSAISKRTGASIHDSIDSKRRNTFLALGNGGVAPGIDVFNKLRSLGNPHLQFRSATFSTRKEQDRRPVLTPDELTDILEYSENGTLIIFDEDSDTGGTLKRIQKYFSGKIHRTTELIVLSNCGTFQQKHASKYIL